MLIGYVRVSTNDQNTDLQRNALRAPDQFEIPPNRVIELGTQVEI